MGDETMTETEKNTATAGPIPIGDGEVITAFATLPPGAVLNKKAVAGALGCAVRTVERMEKAGALPPAFVWQGRRCWRAGTIQDFFDRLALRAVKDAKKLENIA